MLDHCSQASLGGSQPADGGQGICCRQIEPADLASIVDLLVVGFPRRRRSYWARALDLLSQRPVIEGCPRYGYMLACDGAPVGVMLLLFSKAPGSGEIRCNGSSWYVAPAFRSLAVRLVMRALKHPVTHTNLSPAPHVERIFETLGYRKFCSGLFAIAPSLAASEGKTKIIRIATNAESGAPGDQLGLLRDHARFGCISLWCESQGQASLRAQARGGAPLIFRLRFVKGLPGVPAAQLVYCDSLEQFAAAAAPVGRYLALRGMPFMIAPANGPIPGLAGKFFDHKPMYFRGAQPPRLGDLSYSELAMFGI